MFKVSHDHKKKLFCDLLSPRRPGQSHIILRGQCSSGHFPSLWEIVGCDKVQCPRGSLLSPQSDPGSLARLEDVRDRDTGYSEAPKATVSGLMINWAQGP